jgi:hypothetical protein
MRQIDNPQIWSDAVHHALAERHGIIDHSEIGHENNSWRRSCRGLLGVEKPKILTGNNKHETDKK